MPETDTFLGRAGNYKKIPVRTAGIYLNLTNSLSIVWTTNF